MLAPQITHLDKTAQISEPSLNHWSLCRGPDGLLQLIGLSARQIQDNASLLEESDINRLRNQTPGII